MITSEQCIDKFKKEYSYRLEKSTIKCYCEWVMHLIMYCGKHFQDITTGDIRNWMLNLEIKSNKAKTIKTKLTGIKLFYKFCVEEDIIYHNPVASIPYPEVEEKPPHYLQHKQLTQLRELLNGEKQERAIVELLYATGIRISELSALKKEDISWSERIITIQKGKRKKGRIVLFTRYCAEYLLAYLQTRNDNLPFLFLNRRRKGPVCIRTIQNDFVEYAKQLEMHLTPHTLRHTFAAHLAIKGMPLECIQVLLGHDVPHQTQLYARLYSHARKEMYDEWM